MFISDNKIVRDICVVLLFSLGIIYISKKCYK
jgi:hypothetical protein